VKSWKEPEIQSYKFTPSVYPYRVRHGVEDVLLTSAF
jgi:hypothetical protein